MKEVEESIDILVDLAVDAVLTADYHTAKRLLDAGLYEEPGYARIHGTLAWMYHYFRTNTDMAELHYLWAIRLTQIQTSIGQDW